MKNKLQRSSGYKLEFLLYIFLGISTSIYVCFFNNSNEYSLLWLLPFFYTILTFCYYLLIKDFQLGIIFKMSIFFVFIRYVITPFSIVFSHDFDGMGYGPDPVKSNINLAIVLMVVELLSVYLITYFAVIHYSKKKINQSETGEIFFLKNKIVIFLFVVVAFFLVVLWNPTVLLPQIGSIINSSNELENVASNSNIMNLLSNGLRVSIFLILLSLVHKKYRKNKKILYIIIAWVLIMVYLSVIISSSRWTMLFSIITILPIMLNLFPETSRFMYIVFGILCLVALLLISINKYSWSVRNSSNVFRDIIIVLLGQFQEYFSGPRVVAQSIEMNYAYGSEIGLSTLLNDFLGSVPGLANYVDQTNRINVYFNRHLNVGNVTHIIPMIGMGYSYFLFFPMIFSIIFEWFMIKFDFLQRKSVNIEFKYIYGFIGLFFAMTMGFNSQIIWGNFLTNFLPLWILFMLNRKIKLRG